METFEVFASEPVAEKRTWKTVALGLVIGIAIGLAWKPYTVQPQRLGDVSAMMKCNRITGKCWINMPGDTHWKPVEHEHIGDGGPRPDPRF